MSRPNHDSPYLDAPASHVAPQRDSASRPSRRTSARSAHATPLSPEPAKDASSRRRSRRRHSRPGGTASHGQSRLTSQPTSRTAYMETRLWLLEQHGPTCAYCGRTFSAGVMTLDHVAPRRGQTAYDRRDNLVLACPGCNAAKRDMAPIAFLLGSRSRAINLVRYGAHLSPMLVELARSLAPESADAAPLVVAPADMIRWAALFDELDADDESPYRD